MHARPAVGDSMCEDVMHMCILSVEGGYNLIANSYMANHFFSVLPQTKFSLKVQTWFGMLGHQDLKGNQCIDHVEVTWVPTGVTVSASIC